METKEAKATGNNKATTTAAAKPVTGNGQEKANAPITNKDETNKAAEPKKEESPAPVKPAEQPQAPEPAKEQPQAQAAASPKEEKQEAKIDKPALNLESTLKLVEELHRRKLQRDKLLDTINTLEAFEVAQREDADETDGNHFQGCVLTIEDDQRRKFSTKNPVIILEVAQYVNFMCISKLSEIEAGITIPA